MKENVQHHCMYSVEKVDRASSSGSRILVQESRRKTRLPGCIATSCGPCHLSPVPSPDFTQVPCGLIANTNTEDSLDE